MRFAYADPPYHRMGKKLYGKLHDQASIWDNQQTHIDLITKLCDEYPDGWALSCNPKDLNWLLPHTPPPMPSSSLDKNLPPDTPNIHPIRMGTSHLAHDQKRPQTPHDPRLDHRPSHPDERNTRSQTPLLQPMDT